MAQFQHKRHNRIRIASGQQAEAFRGSPHWREIAEDAPDASVLHDTDPDTMDGGLDVPEGNISAVLAWVGDDPDRRAAALYAERHGKGRSTLIEKLSE